LCAAYLADEIEQRVFCLADAARRQWPSERRPPASGRQKIPLD
jgi:hypothetical protein